MTDRDDKTLLENPTQDEIEAAGQEYYGDNSSKPAKVVKAGKYIMLLRKKAVFQKHQIAERDTEITRLNERVLAVEGALYEIMRYSNERMQALDREGQTTHAANMAHIYMTTRAALSPKERP